MLSPSRGRANCSLGRVRRPACSTQSSSLLSSVLPAFLAPTIEHLLVHPFSSSSSRPLPPPQVTNLKNTYRRLNLKWDDDLRPDKKQKQKQTQTQRKLPEDKSPTLRYQDGKQHIQRKYSEDLHDLKARTQQRIGYRIRAKNLQQHLTKVAKELDSLKHRSDSSILSEKFDEAMAHFQSEMKALRVMIKDKDILLDPENAWISASRIKSPYNSAIFLCLNLSRPAQAIKLFNDMKKDGIFPNATTYTILISGLTRSFAASKKKSSPDSSPDSPAVARIQDLYFQLEDLWKQAFPQYFNLPLRDKDYLFHQLNQMTEQDRRNHVSQQASILELRDFPKNLTNALTAYLRFLGIAELEQEKWDLLDRIFPDDLIDSATASSAKHAYTDTSERPSSFSDQYPVGDITTITSTFVGVHTPDKLKDSKQDFKYCQSVERIWAKLEKLIQAELTDSAQQSHRTNVAHILKPRSPGSSQDRRTQKHGESDPQEASARFVPDDQFMQTLLTRVNLLPDSKAVQLVLRILRSFYGLELSEYADGVLQPPASQPAYSLGSRRYCFPSPSSYNDVTPLLTELRDPLLVDLFVRTLSRPDTWKLFVSLFNYLWLRAHEESLITPSQPFGPCLRPVAVVSLLWSFAHAGDPIASRILIDTMADAAKAGTDTKTSNLSSEKWAPDLAAYARAIRAIEVAVVAQPNGLTAARIAANTRDPSSSAFDAWTEAKHLIQHWHKSTSTRRQPRSSEGRESLSDSDSQPSYPSAGYANFHETNIASSCLTIARRSEKGKKDPRATAREALQLLESTFGLKQLVHQIMSGGADPSSPSSSGRAQKLVAAKLSRCVHLALDTTDHSFAPKEDVELWKSLKSALPPPTSSASGNKGGSRQPKSFGSSPNSSANAGSGLNNSRLLLSRDDHLELQAQAELEDEDAFFDDLAESGGRKSAREERRSRHIDQELDRWVRGG